jgi:dolichol-phosphate mannosyltransferase
MSSQAPASPERGTVTIVLPARNEEEAIGPTLRSIPKDTLRSAGFEVQTMVLDGHSDDRTRDVVYKHGGATVVFDQQLGKARALINARELFEGDYVVMLDADGTYPPEALPRVLAPLTWDEADVVMGARRPQPGAMAGLHKFGNVVLSSLASLLYGRWCRDLCTGMWGFRSEALHALPLRSHRFELEAEMFALASRLGLRIEETTIDYLPRRGSSKLTMSDAVRIVWWLLRSRVVRLDPETSPEPSRRNSHAPLAEVGE